MIVKLSNFSAFWLAVLPLTAKKVEFQSDLAYSTLMYQLNMKGVDDKLILRFKYTPYYSSRS